MTQWGLRRRHTSKRKLEYGVSCLPRRQSRVGRVADLFNSSRKPWPCTPYRGDWRHRKEPYPRSSSSSSNTSHYADVQRYWFAALKRTRASRSGCIRDEQACRQHAGSACTWCEQRQALTAIFHARCYRQNLMLPSFQSVLVPNSTTRHRLRTCCTTPPTNELTTILQLVVQQIHHQRTQICHIPTSWHVEMLGSGIAMWQICCTASCRIIVVSFVRLCCCTTCP